MFTHQTPRRWPLIAMIGYITVTPLLAQPETVHSQSADAIPICMTRNQALNPTDANSSEVKAIVAVRQSVPDLEARGFKATDCERAGLETPADFAKYRDEVCNLASYGNEAVQAQIAETIGEYPSVLCGNAEKISGPWDHKSTGATE